MMKLTLVMDLDNAAFRDPNAEDLLDDIAIAAVIQEFVVDRIEVGKRGRQVIRDVNGNGVGEWRITADNVWDV